LHVLPGDHLTVRVYDRKAKEEIAFTEDIGRTMEVDAVVTFDAEDVLGVDGIGVLMGKQI